MEKSQIRNFCIIAHIDHGKSTLADRLLEFTGTVAKRDMQAQLLDSMDLERERGITIKLTPVRMTYKDYVLNLIDTPGHVDFNYEVSRSLAAVEGAVLLVDASQGVQAQTLSNIYLALAADLKIIPVLNKIDLPAADVGRVSQEVIKLLACKKEDILLISAKTGEGVEQVLERVVSDVPPPAGKDGATTRALIFDSYYDEHRGVVLYIRLVDGQIVKSSQVKMLATGAHGNALDVGFLSPEMKSAAKLVAGEIGYIVTNLKSAREAKVGDTITATNANPEPLPGYKEVKPMVYAGIFPAEGDNYSELRNAMDKLKLNDSALFYEPEHSQVLGFGFRCGFLGMLHMEIIMERLKREFGLKLIAAVPTITYKVETSDGKVKEIYSPMNFPEDGQINKIFEPWADTQIIIPPERLGAAIQLLYEHEAEVGEVEQFGQRRSIINAKMSLRELMRNFFDALKSATAGYGSLNYKISEMREASKGSVVKLDIWVAEEIVPAFSRIVSKNKVQKDAEAAVEKLRELIPRALFTIKIQAKAMGRILAARSIAPMKKDVTGYLYGGDITRKMKLWQKQKKGKEKMKKLGKGRADIPHDVFIKMMQ